MKLQTQTSTGKIIARHLLWRGCVQGVGIRPTIARAAIAAGVCGWVANCQDGVEIVIEGPADNLDDFTRKLSTVIPEIATLTEQVVQDVSPQGYHAFEIRDSISSHHPASTQIPRDVLACDACLQEVADPTDRRYAYPFTTCVSCGPRFSIVNRMPFDRQRTQMSAFTLCRRCQQEFDDPLDRRFHAQTISCPECGPHLWSTDRFGRTVADSNAAMNLAANIIRESGIVALRGVGGYQLVCDATQNDAVQRLRDRKGRRSKPFAVMVESLAEAEQVSYLDAAERQALVSSANPIVIVRGRESAGIAHAVHPGLNSIGIMLPTSPLHWMLLKTCGRSLVVTSGNIEGDPLQTEVEHSQSSLSDIAELWLHHDRPIQHALDDSVVRIIGNRPVTLRLARGLAPLPLSIKIPESCHLFAAGGHHKSAFALSNGMQAISGPHIGDLDGISTRERFVKEVGQILRLYDAQPDVYIHDLHPTYFTTEWAQSQRRESFAVQHHHAHIVAGMCEHRWLDREVLGVAFDGTGYGTDKTIWGGEFLRCTVHGFERVGHLRTFPLVGGDTAIRNPIRVAVALVHEALTSADIPKYLTDSEVSVLSQICPLLQKRPLAPITSSVGRLFDGVAALVLGLPEADYEGQLAQQLESICDVSDQEFYSIDISDDEPAQLDWRPMVRALLRDRRSGASAGQMAMRFHRGLAKATASICRTHRLPVVLGGGVFQNQILIELLRDELLANGCLFGLPGMIPPNDGGLAVGQLAVGAAKMHGNGR